MLDALMMLPEQEEKRPISQGWLSEAEMVSKLHWAVALLVNENHVIGEFPLPVQRR